MTTSRVKSWPTPPVIRSGELKSIGDYLWTLYRALVENSSEGLADFKHIDHNALINYIAQEHIRWDLAGEEEVYIDRIPANLIGKNADQWDGYEFADYLDQEVKQTSSPIFDKIDLGTKQIQTTTKARAYRNGNQTNTASGWQKVKLNAESFDTGDNFDAVTNFRFIAPIPGCYSFCGRMEFTNGASTARLALAVYKNGAIASRLGDENNVPASAIRSFGGADYIDLALSDYLELFYYTDQTDGTITGGGIYDTFLAVHLLSI